LPIPVLLPDRLETYRGATRTGGERAGRLMPQQAIVITGRMGSL